MQTSITIEKEMAPAESLTANNSSSVDISSQAGFSLIEAAIALVIILIALLGVAWTITYAITYNAGNNNRGKTLAVLQQEVERLRSAKFTPTSTDAVLNGCDLGEVCSEEFVVSENLNFVVIKTIDNNPATPEIDTETEVASSATSFKEIKLTARLATPSPGWQTAVPADVVLRRVKSN